MIYRCNQCGFIAEENHAAAGSKIPCARCQNPSTVYPTVFYLEKVLERYTAALRELKALKAAEAAENEIPATDKEESLNLGDIHNTASLANAKQHAPIQEWFHQKQIQPHFDYARVDTSGFFDDAACTIGENYALYSNLLDRICFSYRKNYTRLSVELSKFSQKEGQALHQFCRTLYSHSFFAHFYYEKQAKIIRLTLQTAPIMRQFFNGEWLEWYVFMVLLKKYQKSPKHFSYARGVKVNFSNEDLHEFDVVCLPQGKNPIFIECKTGEFRHDIEKYTRLRKRLGVEKSHFILCVADLSDEQAKGLSAMYELSFVNLTMLESKLSN